MILSSIFCALSGALKYFPPGCLSLCLFGGMSFFGYVWNSMGFDSNFRCKKVLSAERIVFLVLSMQLSVIFSISIPAIFFISLIKNVYGYRKFPPTGFTGRPTWNYVSPSVEYVVFHFSFFIPSHIDGICFCGTEMFNVFQSDKKLKALTMSVDSVLIFKPWWSSNWLNLLPVCTVNLIISEVRYILPVRLTLSSKLTINFLTFVLHVRPPRYRYVFSMGYIYSNGFNFASFFVFFWYESTAPVWLIFLWDTANGNEAF